MLLRAPSKVDCIVALTIGESIVTRTAIYWLFLSIGREIVWMTTCVSIVGFAKLQAQSCEEREELVC
jgi:hypothetical protein